MAWNKKCVRRLGLILTPISSLAVTAISLKNLRKIFKIIYNDSDLVVDMSD